MKLKKTQIKFQSFKGKKVWEIKVKYHSLIIGTCFKLDDFNKILNKSCFDIKDKANDYKKHNSIVASISKRNDFSRNVQKMFEKKYTKIYKKIHAINDEDELYKIWRSSIENADFPGVFWAISSHPIADNKFVFSIYSEFYILSHDVLYDSKSKNLKINKLTIVNKDLESSLKEMTIKIKDISFKNRVLEKENKKMSADLNSKEKYIAKIYKKKLSLSLSNDIDELNSKLSETKVKLKSSNDKINELKDENSKLKKEIIELKSLYENKIDDYNILENNFIKDQNQENDTEFCDKKQCGEDCSLCEKNGIRNKRILYVGGVNSTIIKSREIVEENGGIFEHHDGGVEDSKSRLPQMLIQADIVFSPIENVSHAASYMIKKICKQYNKPFVFLRSSGFSSFVRELLDVTKPSL